MAIIYNHFLILTCLLCVKSRDVSYNRCVTWSDDLWTLTITCRVDNFTLPVTISHAKTGTHINCTIAEGNFECYPRGKNISVDRHNHTASIQLIELKKNGLFEEQWRCQQGITILVTNVAYTEGIISDSWVHIRGRKMSSTDGKKYVIVECSSCRKPQANYVEFLVNDRPRGSMSQNKSLGLCTYNAQACTPLTCNCSSTENMYSLRLPLTNSISDIACEMHFHDKLRIGKHRSYAKMKITEKDVSYGEPTTEVLVQNKNTVTIQTKNNTVVSNDTGISTSLILVITIVTMVACIGTITFIVKCCIRKPRKIDAMCCIQSTGSSEMRTDIDNFNNEEYTDLLPCKVFVDAMRMRTDIDNFNNEEYTELFPCKVFDDAMCCIQSTGSSEMRTDIDNFNNEEYTEVLPCKVFGENTSPDHIKETTQSLESDDAMCCIQSTGSSEMRTDIDNFNNEEYTEVLPCKVFGENTSPDHIKETTQSLESGSSEVFAESLSSNIEIPESDLLIQKNAGYCKSCQRATAEIFCLNCGDKLCSLCEEYHNKMKSMQQHIMIPLSKVPTSFSMSLFCQSHVENELKLYCTNHKEAICVRCFTAEHENCKISDIGNQFEPEDALDDINFETNEIIRSLGRDLDLLYLNFKAIKKMTDEIKSKIEISGKRLPLGKELHDKIKRITDEHTQKYQSRFNEISNSLTAMKNEKNNLAFVRKHLIDKFTHLLVYLNQATKLIEDTKRGLENTGKTFFPKRIDFNITFADPSMGKIELIENDIAKQDESELTAATQTPAKYSCKTRSLNFLSSNFAYVNDKSIAFITTETSFLHMYNVEEDSWCHFNINYLPYDIAGIPSSKRVVVTNNAKSKLLDINVETGEIKELDIESCANATLAVTPAFILLGLRRKNIISVIRHSGEKVMDIETQSEVNRLAWFDDRICYLSSESKSLVAINVNGDEMFRHIRPNIPIDTVFTNNGDIMLLEDSKEGLKMYSKYGQELQFDFKDEFVRKNPNAICNSDASRIYVLSNDGVETYFTELWATKEDSSSLQDRYQEQIND